MFYSIKFLIFAARNKIKYIDSFLNIVELKLLLR